MNQELEIVKKIDAALETMRPYLIADGGNIAIQELTEDMILKVKLLGACESCPMSFMTMKAGIEEAVKKAVPEIKEVVAVNAVEVSN